ncbi:MAG: hypothetical protein WCJ64_04985 [Rhodospirillaceae bacterium]
MNKNEPISNACILAPALIQMTISVNCLDDIRRLREVMPVILSMPDSEIKGQPRDVADVTQTVDVSLASSTESAKSALSLDKSPADVTSVKEVPVILEKPTRKASPASAKVITAKQATLVAAKQTSTVNLEPKAVLAEVEGFARKNGLTALRVLLDKHGGGSFSRLDPSVYPALLADMKAGV